MPLPDISNIIYSYMTYTQGQNGSLGVVPGVFIDFNEYLKYEFTYSYLQSASDVFLLGYYPENPANTNNNPNEVAYFTNNYNTQIEAAFTSAFSIHTPSSYDMLFGDVAHIAFRNVSLGGTTLPNIAIGQLSSSYPVFQGTDNTALSKAYDVNDNGANASQIWGDIWVNNDNQAWANIPPDPGSLTYKAVLEEITHSLGFDIVGSVWQGTFYDNQKYTVTSYNFAPGFEKFDGNPALFYPARYPVSPHGLQILDILAIQNIYGRNYEKLAGNTSIDFHDMNPSSYKSDPFLYTIWDGSGDDTIDVSTSDWSAQIDLRQGRFSSIGQDNLHNQVIWDGDASVNDPDPGNVAIAYYTVIENAIGTDHDDSIIGNSWNNVLTGGDGDDYIYGDGIVYDGNTGFQEEDPFRPWGGDNVRYKDNGGDDTLYGNAGEDHLFGGGGNDFLSGGDDDDELIGGEGDDTLFGDTGNDILNAGNGTNVVFGGDGNDEIYLTGSIKGSYLGEGDDDTFHASFSGEYSLGGNSSYRLDVIADGGTGSDTLSVSGAGYLEFTNATTFKLWDAHADQNLTFQNMEAFERDAAAPSAKITVLAANAANGNLNYTSYDLSSVTGYNNLKDFDYSQRQGGLSFAGVNDNGNDFLSVSGAGLGHSLYNTSYNSNSLIIRGTNYGDTVSNLKNTTFISGYGDDIVSVSEGYVKYVYTGGDDVLTVSDNAFFTLKAGKNVQYEDVTGWNWSGIYLNSTDGYYYGTFNLNFANGDTLSVSNQQLYFNAHSEIYSTEVIFEDVAKGVIFYNNNTLTEYSDVGSTLNEGTWGNDVYQARATDDLYYAFAGDDSFTGGAGSDTAYMGDGDDTADGAGGNDYLYGHKGNDTLVGGSGNDSLDGGEGNDTLTGGEGDDLLRGGYGDDTYVYTAGDGTDTITEFRDEGFDKLYIYGYTETQLNFLSLTGAFVVQLLDGTDLITFDQSFMTSPQGAGFSDISSRIEEIYLNDVLIFGPNNIFPGNSYFTGTSSDDLVNAGDGYNLIEAGAGNDTIYGNGGNDEIYGEADNDIINGGEGDDYLDGGAGDDIINGGLGNDNVNGGLGDDTYVYAQGDGSEYIYGNAGEGANTLWLTDLNASDIRIIKGQVGTLAYAGGGLYIQSLLNSNDVIQITSSWPQNNNLPYHDLFLNAITTIRFADDTVWDLTQGVTINTAGLLDLTLNGTSGNDILYGEIGDDTLFGYAGNDILYGGTGGADYLYGGTGSDTYYLGGDDTRIIDEAGDSTIFSSAGTNLILLSTGGNYTLHTGYGQDTVGGDLGYESAATGSVYLHNYDKLDLTYSLDDYNFVIKNLAGNILLDIRKDSGDYGAVSFYFDSENTTPYTMYELAMMPTHGDDNFSLSASGVGINIDMLEGNDTISGSHYDDIIYGNAGGDTIDGQGGNDVINGGEGDDILNGSAGNDIYVFEGNFGNDVIEFFVPGEDKIDISSFTNITLFSQLQTTNIGNGQTVITLEGVTGSITVNWNNGYAWNGTNFIWSDGGNGYGNVPTQYDDVLTGTESGDYISALQGNDTVYGLGGNDALYGGSGNDTLYGNDGDDQITGDAGNDTIFGGAGNDDRLDGSQGDDVIYGEDGDDRIYSSLGQDAYHGGNGIDSLSFSNVGNEAISVDLGSGTILNDGWGYTETVTGFENVYVESNYDATIIGNSDNNEIYTNFGADTISGGAGHDVIVSGGGNDTVFGDDGDDFLSAFEGDDELHGGNGNDTILGFYGNDTMYGDDGDDQLWGHEGDDWIDGGAGYDVVYVGAGTDNYNGGDIGPNALSFAEVDSTYWYEMGAYTQRSIVDLAQGQIINDGWGYTDTIANFTEVYSYNTYGSDLFGDNGNNILQATEGNNTFNGRGGDDTLRGNANGIDTFIFEGNFGNDQLSEFTANQDKIDLTAFSNINSISDLTILANGSGGLLVTSSQWSGQSINIAAISTLTENDFIFAAPNVPTENDDVIYGTENGETINALGGNDIVHGLSGTDYLYGGSGDDTLYGGDGDDFIHLDTGSDFADGGNGSDNIYDFDLEDDEIFGGADNDYIYVGGGSDYYDGGSGFDSLVFDLNNQRTNIDFSTGFIYNDGFGYIDHFANIERVFSHNLYGADIKGSSGYEYIYLGQGNNVVTVTSGGDWIDLSSNGVDTLNINSDFGNLTLQNFVSGQDKIDVSYFAPASNWSDISFVQNGNNTTVYFAGSASSITLWNHTQSLLETDFIFRNFATQWDDTLIGTINNDVIDGLGGNDSIYGFEGDDQLTGGEGDDILYGFEGGDYLNGGAGDDDIYGDGGNDSILDGEGNDYVEGGSGNDLIVVGSGSDYYYGGDGIDTLLFNNDRSYQVFLTLENGAIYNDGFGSFDEVVGFENVISHSSYGANIRGSSAQNTFVLTQGNNTISVSAGSDIIHLISTGVDTLNFAEEFGNMTIHSYRSGQDVLDFRLFQNIHGWSDVSWSVSGNDTLVTFANTASTLTLKDYTSALQQSDFLLGTFGTSGNDLLEGTEGDDYIYGLGGSDTIYGYGGRDRLEGGDQNDWVYGGAGNDTVKGNAGDDVISGQEGNDRLYGGDGLDYLWGNEGVDFLWGEADADALRGMEGDDYLYGGTGNDNLRGDDVDSDPNFVGAGNDYLYGEAGNDNLSGGAGNDVLVGGTGQDTMNGDAGSDTFLYQNGDIDGSRDYIYGFQSGVGGDRIDISDVLQYNSATDNLSDFVFLVQGGSYTRINIDIDGTGTTYGVQAVAQLQNVTGLNLTDMVSQGNLVVE